MLFNRTAFCLDAFEGMKSLAYPNFFASIGVMLKHSIDEVPFLLFQMHTVLKQWNFIQWWELVQS